MNAARRKEIQKAADLISEAYAKAQEALEVLQNAKDDEQEYFDNMPEVLQASEKGQRAEEAVSCMEEAIEMLSQFEELDLSTAME